MSEYAPRCPFCANVLKLHPSLWERIGLKNGSSQCPTCRRKCEARDAHTMGAAYGHWAESFRKELAALVADLPILNDAAANRALGTPHRDDTRLIPSFNELLRTCMQQHRGVLIEMARGRDATLECVHLNNEMNLPETVGVLSTGCPEGGAREIEQLIARIGNNHYILYNYPTAAGAEPRLKRAVHGKPVRDLMNAHVNAMQAHPQSYAHRPH